MVKKISKKNKNVPRRMSEMQRTIEEGRQFVQASSRRRRAIKPTRTMVDIVRGSLKINKKKKKPTLKRIKRVPIRKVKVNPKNRKTMRKTNPAASSGPSPITIPVSAFPTGVMKTESRKSMGKATKFKTKSRDDLQIPAFGFIDVCFCVDATGSMSGQIAQVQSIIESIINNIENKVRTQGLQLRFAVVTYRDHPPQDSSYVTKINDFTDNFETIKYVKTLSAGGGGDQPQAAHDGLYDSATKLNWAEVPGTPVLRYIFHIADAPPHGKQFGNPQAHDGCLCGMQTDDVIREINKKQIHYRLIKVRNNYKVDTMETIFQKKIGDFASTDIKNASELNVKVSDMIIHEVLPDYA